MNEQYIEKQLYYHDTDAIGIMYYGACFKIFEEGRTDYFNKNMINVSLLHKQKRYFVIKSVRVDYVTPGRFGDHIVCESYIKKQSGARIVFKQKILNKMNNQMIAVSETVLVLLNNNLKPERVSRLFDTQAH